MRQTTYLALFAAGAVAQESATILDIFQFASTVTQIGADATATTYMNKCPAGSTGLSAIPTEMFLDESTQSTPTATPAPTAAARFRRQDSSSSSSADLFDYSLCEEVTIKQGPSTYGFQFTDPESGAWTMSADCNFSGDIKTADVTCTANIDGSYASRIGNAGKTTEVLSASDASEFSYIRTVAVVSASASGSSSARPTGSQSGTPSGSAAVTSSTGLAASGPMPTGAMAYGLGVAGVFAAAFAL